MSEKWVIGLDMDGTTLMDWDGSVNEAGKRVDRVHPFTLKAIKKMQDLGHVIVINTGRNWVEATPQYKLLECNSYISNSAGAHIHNPCNPNAEEFIDGVSPEIIKEIINDEKINKHINQWFVDNVNDTHMKVIKKDGFEENCNKFWVVEEFDGEFDFKSQCTVLTMSLSREEIAPLVEYLYEKYPEGIHFTNWDIPGYTNGIEFNPSTSNKGTAILKIAETLGIPVSNTMGFGDAENDIELIKQSTHGVVMANGLPHIKELGNHITEKTNNEGGVGHFLNEWFNLGLEE